VFIIKDQPHSLYHREGNDIIYQPVIPLATALVGGAIEMMTLDGRHIQVPITDVVHPGHEIRVVGEGMPLSDHPNQRGDMIIRFAVSFPSKLNPEQKLLIKKALVN
jgi:DnaJ-class molecular chaperone